VSIASEKVLFWQRHRWVCHPDLPAPKLLGSILCSNAAPHHPCRQDVAWQQHWNHCILAGW